jgi:hypothetical protein
MKHSWPLVAAAGALAVPSFAWARPVTLDAQLSNYGGDGAYLAIYVTDHGGAYKSTLWIAGTKAKYWRHLGAWYRATGGKVKVDGISGASVGAGKTLRVTVDVADALLDAGYEIHIDTAAEKMKENSPDVVVPFTTAGAGKPVAGRGYVKAFRYTL